mgnify:FL=1
MTTCRLRNLEVTICDLKMVRQEVMMYYHVWFVTKYRKKILEGKIRSFILESFLEICQHKNYNILEIGLGAGN